jgi:hypothetical protein
LKKILTSSEQLFEPKKILGSSDWLACQKESGQSFDKYDIHTTKNPVTIKRNKIYIFVIDPTIDQEFLNSLKLYCEAFYTGMVVELMLPKTSDFMKTFNIKNRINSGT